MGPIEQPVSNGIHAAYRGISNAPVKAGAFKETKMEYAVHIQTIGLTPDGQPLYCWTEEDGTEWEEFWQAIPGGGLVQTREL